MTKRKAIAAAAACAALVLSMGIAPAFGYFTDSTYATGSLTINVKPSTDIDEEYGEGIKHVTVSNSAEATVPVYVRARVFTSLEYTAQGSNWGEADSEGWYLYGSTVDPGAKTESLDVKLTFPVMKSADAPDGAEPGDTHNVIVIYESTPVQYDEAGNPYADWSLALHGRS